jgi:membrane protease YdiL (CAAX protease family)
MTSGDATDVRSHATVVDAAAILRPALVLWVAVATVGGAGALVAAYVEAAFGRGSAAVLAVGEGCYLVIAAVVGASAYRDRDACWLFAPAPATRVAGAVVLGLVAAAALVAWERAIPSIDRGWPSWAEREAGWPIWAQLLTSALLPAVIEELMFRGVILQRLRAVGTTTLAVAAQAMMFAVLHWNPVLLLPGFVFGCLAGALRVAVAALWAPMLLHLAWNTAAVLDWL